MANYYKKYSNRVSAKRLEAFQFADHAKILRQGQTGRLFYYFFKPIFDLRPSDCDLEDWCDLMFGAHDRIIQQYESLESFEVPGIYKPTIEKMVPGYLGNRLVKPNRRIFTRLFKNAPDKIEVEVPNDVGGQEKIFQLTDAQWSTCLPYLLFIPPFQRKKPEGAEEIGSDD